MKPLQAGISSIREPGTAYIVSSRQTDVSGMLPWPHITGCMSVQAVNQWLKIRVAVKGMLKSGTQMVNQSVSVVATPRHCRLKLERSCRPKQEKAFQWLGSLVMLGAEILQCCYTHAGQPRRSLARRTQRNRVALLQTLLDIMYRRLTKCILRIDICAQTPHLLRRLQSSVFGRTSGNADLP